MAVLNPNPYRITGPIWDLWIWFDALEPTVSLGGVYAAKGGYHDEPRPGDYSYSEVANDRKGPAGKASAIDLTMSDAAMRKYTSRLDVAAKTRDERLFIGGAPIIREFIGTKDSARVYCYVLTGGRARGLPADAAEDWRRDSTHLWHLHISIIRMFAGSADAMDRLYSVLAGESITSWRARRAPSRNDDPEEDDTMFLPIPLPHGFAYDEDLNVIDLASTISLPLPPAGLGKYAGKGLYLSFSGDHIEPATPVKLRVAINNGGGWSVKTVEVTTGKRINLVVPGTTDPQAYSVTIGRVAAEVPAHANVPVGLLIEVV